LSDAEKVALGLELTKEQETQLLKVIKNGN
jgi:hypothetical protein